MITRHPKLFIQKFDAAGKLLELSEEKMSLAGANTLIPQHQALEKTSVPRNNSILLVLK